MNNYIETFTLTPVEALRQAEMRTTNYIGFLKSIFPFVVYQRELMNQSKTGLVIPTSEIAVQIIANQVKKAGQIKAENVGVGDTFNVEHNIVTFSIYLYPNGRRGTFERAETDTEKYSWSEYQLLMLFLNNLKRVFRLKGETFNFDGFDSRMVELLQNHNAVLDIVNQRYGEIK